MIAVMRAFYVRIVVECAAKQSLDSVVAIAGYTTVQLNTGRCQCHLRTASDAAADQDICSHSIQQACQRAVTLPLGADNFTA
jgi:hypothetical protein